VVIELILQADRLLNVDQVEGARGMYARVVELDPGNAIAVVGLARCALADGDDAKAYHLAARALVIDPENDMARRMEARLAEILSVRGEAVERGKAASIPGGSELRPIVSGGSPAPLATAAGNPSTAATSTPSPRRSLIDRLRGR
jgi:tetratricopeptide (TPR) repeat protein